MRRAARRAHERAKRVAGTLTGRDPGELSFSQAWGYEEIRPVELEELSSEARTAIWNAFFAHVRKSTTTDFNEDEWVCSAWADILQAKHCHFDHLRIDYWNPEFSSICKDLHHYIEEQPFNQVFDLIQFVLRHPACPRSFTEETVALFKRCGLAYVVDIGPPPTIIPAVTPEEGNTVVDAAETLRRVGLNGSALHLAKASECLNRGDWAGSVRESIHAVESVARQLDPEAARRLGPALKSLERHRMLHPALKKAFSELYGYTSDEQGIRHALLDRTDAQVGKEEALFMLGSCASFASYLWRKHAAGESR